MLRAITPEHYPVLVVAPKRVAEHVWEPEQMKWRPNLNLIVAKGSPTQRARAINSGADITVIGRDNLKDVAKRTYKTVVLDELSGFKSYSAARSKYARWVTKNATYVWGLTGTPAPNGLLDLWHELFLLDRGERLGTTFGGYQSRYFRPEAEVWNNRLRRKVVSQWGLKPGAETAIHRKVDDICLSMAAEDYLDLPPVLINSVAVDIPAKAMKLYDEIRDTLVADLSLIGTPQFITAANAAVLTSKLSQISAGFLYDENRVPTTLHASKMEALNEIVDGTGSPVLVFYRFREELAMLKTAFPQARAMGEPLAYTDWNDGKLPMLLAHPVAAGHGLNLQHSGAHTIVWTSLPWSLEEYEQANSRLIRPADVSSMVPVVIHILMGTGIDTIMSDRLALKAGWQDALLDHLKGAA